mmetsp:Transcript_8494/g.25156  ORF Transcript_8494/g.25156 Transcript_8494/m.25156 type:complete len:789 (-) Transcript_8494:2739-5105(-)
MAKDNSHKIQTGRSRVASWISVAVTVLLLTMVVVWHGEQTSVPSATTAASSAPYRFLASMVVGDVGDDPPENFDDDTTRSAVCRRYLMNFLNGTTDARDECQAFYNAYREADCAHETTANIFGGGSGSGSGSSSGSGSRLLEDKNSSSGGSGNGGGGDDGGDDAGIDDFFEHWECCDSIKVYYNSHCEHDSGVHSLQLLGVMLVFLLCAMIKAVLKTKGVNWLPDACAFILVGTLVGGILRLLDSNLVPRLSFDNDLFLQIMLPPIIFEAALSIDKKAFRRDLFPILLFAGVGTAVSSIAIGWMVHHVSNLGANGTNLPWLDSLVFGSLISSIDPVATLSILAGVGVSQTDTLYTLVFGESLLNDGVAIVLFEVLKDHLGEDDSIGPDTYREMTRHFAVVLFGSIAIGVVVGMCCTLYFWVLREQQTAVTEVGIFFCWSLIPYYIADGLHCSGIIAIMVMGFFLDFFVIGGCFQSEGHAWREVLQQEHDAAAMHNNAQNYYTYSAANRLHRIWNDAFSGKGHILETSRSHVGFVAHVVAMIMETAIFAYLGLFLFNDNEWNLRLNFTAIASCVTSRFLMVVGLSLLVNVAVFFDFEQRIGRCFKAINPLRTINLAEDDDDDDSSMNERKFLDRRTQLILLLAGVRGAVSFALVENIPVWDNVSKTGSQYKAELKTMTSSSIVFTLFFFGALTYMAVKHGSESERAHALMTNRLLNDNGDGGGSGGFDAQFAEPTARSFTMEMDHDPRNSEGHHLGMPNGRHLEGMGGGPPNEPNNPDSRYLSSNEWIS